jgi:hypothetical protein
MMVTAAVQGQRPMPACIATWRRTRPGFRLNEERYTMHSDRLGGDAIPTIEPIHIPVNYEYIYAKDAQ